MSNKNIIHIDLQDHLLDVIEKIKPFQESFDPIYLCVDKRHVLLRELSYLKIIKEQFSRQKFFIVQSAHISKRIGESIGIRYIRNIHDEDEVLSKKDINIVAHNFTIFEYLRYEIGHKIQQFSFWIKKTRKKQDGKRSNISATYLLFGILTSIFIAGSTIIYFAIPRVTITVTPELFVRPALQNVIFQEIHDENEEDKEWNQEIFTNLPTIQVQKIVHTIELSEVFDVSSYDPETAGRAEWIIDIVNESDEDFKLRPQTRFQTEDGIVFRIQSWASVPAQSTVSVVVVADIIDSFTEFVGERGNIDSGSILHIPGLPEYADRLYARSTEVFSWGNNEIQKIFTQKEYDSFSTLFIQKMFEHAKDDLEAKIRNINTNKPGIFRVLPVRDSITVVDSNSSPDAIVGAYTDEVTFSGDITIQAFIFDETVAIGYLQNLSKKYLMNDLHKTHSGDSQIYIIDVIEREDEPFSMKATVQLDMFFVHNFEVGDMHAGIHRLKSEIAGMNGKDAYTFLLNDPMISNLDISFSPFWKKTIPLNTDHIYFVEQ